MFIAIIERVVLLFLDNITGLVLASSSKKINLERVPTPTDQLVNQENRSIWLCIPYCGIFSIEFLHVQNPVFDLFKDHFP